MTRFNGLMGTFLLLILVSGCVAPKINLFPDPADPLKEFTLQGTQKGKVLVIPVRGIIADNSKEGVFRFRPSMVQEVVSQLRLAEGDAEIKAVLLKIDSPGGSTTASDILYHEISNFKERTGVKVVVALMNLATSGGYYISLPADFIMAHPTTITGSIGVIFLRPNVTGLMGKIGVDVEVNKSGENKDMGSPFRQSTQAEKEILENLTAELGKRFLSLVAAHRNPDPSTMKKISSARLYLAGEALQVGLVDNIGYLSDALLQAKKLAGLPEDAKVVVYRRTAYPNDNLYNPTNMQNELSVGSLGLPDVQPFLLGGFYYLWLPAAGM
ncbi:signal peptide peptidase SppA [Thermodesulfobacteriota bacterium]